MPAHFFEHLAVRFELLILVRQVGPVEKQEFGAEQADTGGAVFDGQRHIARQFDVGVQFDLGAVERARRRVAQSFELLAFETEFALAQLVFGEHLRIGIDNEHPLGAIDDDDLVLAHQLPCLVQRDDAGDVQAARDNRGV